MGTRLGLDKPKGELNFGLTKEYYLFQRLVDNLMVVKKEAEGASIPLYIMTSEKNDAETRDFFEKHDYFGYPKEDIGFFVQEMAAAVDYNCKLYMEDKGRIATSPNGNGGWFSSMKKAGLLDDMKRRGVEWINIFSVDNPLQKMADPVFVGATIESGYNSGAKVVRKAYPEEKMGVMCMENNQPSVIEYYELTDEMANLRDENGILVYGFGVILNYVFKLDRLEEIVEKILPVHVVEKKIPYIDENAKLVKPEEPNGYKFETLVVDMVRLMNNCLPFEVEREKEFAPIKNLHGKDSLDSARELLEKNGVIL
jgi:UDP-N-acetylglucosamine/UDP-N-acetylgalactosamine diphosphorylase